MNKSLMSLEQIDSFYMISYEGMGFEIGSQAAWQNRLFWLDFGSTLMCHERTPKKAETSATGDLVWNVRLLSDLDFFPPAFNGI